MGTEVIKFSGTAPRIGRHIWLPILKYNLFFIYLYG